MEGWLIDPEMTDDILKESQTHLAEAKSCGLTWTIIHKALQSEKSWDKFKDMLHLKLCNANIHTCHVSQKYNMGTMKPLQPMYTDLKQKPRSAVSKVTLQPSAALLKVSRMHRA